jgi:hypothetical protein
MLKYPCIEVLMKMCKFIIMLLLLSLSYILMANPTRYPWLVSLDNEFLDSEMTCAPIAAWESAGSNAVINPLAIIEIAITNIEGSFGSADPCVCSKPAIRHRCGNHGHR